MQFATIASFSTVVLSIALLLHIMLRRRCSRASTKPNILSVQANIALSQFERHLQTIVN